MNSIVVQSVAFRTIDSHEQSTPVKAPYTRRIHEPQEVTVNFFYRGYGNTVLRLTPRYCFKKEWTLNGVHHDLPYKQNIWCQALMVNVKDELHKGDNTLVTTVIPTEADWSYYNPIIGIAVGSPLFGVHLIQSIFTLIFLGTILTMIWLLLAHQGYDEITRCILILAFAIYLQCLQCMHQFNYALDLEKHANYIQFISEHFFAPYAYTESESWHPPLYYWLCTLAIKAFEMIGTWDVWTGVRLISLISYSVFVYFGMRCIMRMLPAPASYIALTLFAFWPSGLISAEWVFNDVLIYPAYAAAFYYTLVWYEEGDSSALLKAFISCALAFMVKTSGMIPTSILGAAIAYKLLIKGTTLRSLLRKDFFIGCVILAEGVLFNYGREIFYFFTSRDNRYMGHLSGLGLFQPSLKSFIPIDVSDLIVNPFFVKWDDPSLWNLQVRTLVFTNTIWKTPYLASLMEFFCLGILAYILLFMITRSSGQFTKLFMLFAGLIIPFASTVSFTILVHMGSCMDFRYIQPALIALVIAFSLSVQAAKEKNWSILYYGGNAIAVIFVAFSILFFELQIWL